MIHIRYQVKTKRYKVTNLKKKSNFKFFQETLQTAHFVMLLDKMYKYEMGPTRTVGATGWTRDAGRTDGRTDGQTGGRSETHTTSLCVGYENIIRVASFSEIWIHIHIIYNNIRIVMRWCVYFGEVRRQIIIQTNDDFSSITTQWSDFKEKIIEINPCSVSILHLSYHIFVCHLVQG